MISTESMAGSFTASKLDEFFKSPTSSFMLHRKRKRRDSVSSVESFDCSSLNSLDVNTLEPPKRRRSLARMTSLANMLSPVKPMKKVGKVLQKSLSLKSLAKSPNKQQNTTPYKKPGPTPTKKRQNSYWSEIADENLVSKIPHSQVKRQEAIYELYRSEADMVEDMKMIQQTYKDSMVTLKYLTEKEAEQIFGHIDAVLPLHKELVSMLEKQRLPDGRTETVGRVLLKWVPSMRRYINHCGNQVYGKALLDEKKGNTQIIDFLERCQESPFSRKLDLWSYLDIPRSRLVKYPLLFKQIQKTTPVSHEDSRLIEEATHALEKIIMEVDQNTGVAKCQFIRSKLHYIDDVQECEEINDCKVILCEGVLKNNRGTKLHVFLFDKVLVLTRQVNRTGSLQYQVYRQPIPVSQLVLEDLKDGQIRKGSFRSAFQQTQTAKNMFRVAFTDSSQGQAHTLQTSDEHSKRQWIQSLQRVAVSIITTDEVSSKTEHRC